MAQKYKKTKYPGVEYSEHVSRRHGVSLDRYFSIRYYREKKQYRECLGWASEGWTAAKAHQIRSDVRAAIKTGNGPQSIAEMREARQRENERAIADAAKGMTLAEVGDRFIVEYAKPNKRSWKDDEERLKLHVKPVLGHLPLEDVTYREIEQLKQHCKQQGYAAATVWQYLALTRRLFNWARQQGWFKGENPTKDVRFPRLNNRRVRFLSNTEEAEFFEAMEDTNTYDMCMISLYAGLRMGEIFALQRIDVDLEAGTLLVRGPDPDDQNVAPKGGQNRTLPINDRLRPILAKRCADCLSVTSLLFLTKKGVAYKEVPSPFRTTLTKLGWNAGVTDRRLRIVAHTFRHTFASRLVAKGVPLPVVQKLMGHSTIQMTMRYVQVDDAQCRSAIDQL